MHHRCLLNYFQFLPFFGRRARIDNRVGSREAGEMYVRVHACAVVWSRARARPARIMCLVCVLCCVCDMVLPRQSLSAGATPRERGLVHA